MMLGISIDVGVGKQCARLPAEFPRFLNESHLGRCIVVSICRDTLLIEK